MPGVCPGEWGAGGLWWLHLIDTLKFSQPVYKWTFGPKQGQDFKPLAAPLDPDIGPVLPLPTTPGENQYTWTFAQSCAVFTSILWGPGLGSSSIASVKKFHRQTIYKLKLKSSVKVKLGSLLSWTLNTRRSKTAKDINKPWSSAKALKEKSRGEATSLIASMAAETVVLVLVVILSRFFEPKTSQIMKRSSPQLREDLTFYMLLPCQQKDTNGVSGWLTEETNMAGDNRGLYIL